jgi:undecaprenyl diphosphate synthase
MNAIPPDPQDQQARERLISKGDIPCHIAIIMDGNGRWAKERGLPRAAGHREGVNSVRDIVEACGLLNVKYLTLYTFSTENWKRPRNEVSTLMRLLLKALRDEADRLRRDNVRLTVIGDITSLPREVQAELSDAIQKTRGNTGLTLNLALSYSGRWDIIAAVRALLRDARAGKLPSDDVSEEVFAGYLSTSSMPDPDLLIRTSGELRVSNFLLYQIAYAELYISRQYWPDFRRAQLYEAISDYQRRERRFGLVSEQVGAQAHHRTS